MMKRENDGRQSFSLNFYLSKFTSDKIKKKGFEILISKPKMVGVTGFEPAASTSQMSRATNCATPRKYEILYEAVTLIGQKMIFSQSGGSWSLFCTQFMVPLIL